MSEKFEVALSVEQKAEPSVVARKPPTRQVTDTDSGTFSDLDATVHKRGATGSEGVRVERGGADPRSASADADETGVVDDSIAGRASPKTRSELRVAQTLVQYLNQRGGRWQAAQMRTGREDGVDCTADDEDGTQLQLQVTTAERSAWSALARSETFDRNETVDDAAEAIRVAIAKKRPKAHSGVVLAIDATDSPRYALQAVADRFRELHAGDAAGSGFGAVWLVGPVPEMVHRLDA